MADSFPHKRQRRGRTGPTVPRARRSLGQHFLVDPQVLERIVVAAGLTPELPVLEIGPGTGALTAALLAAGARVVAVELDDDLCAALRRRFAATPELTLICSNILDHDPGDLLAEAGFDPPYVVVANIPYFITAPILRHLLEAAQPPRQLILMVQREVAESLAARPGQMSLLAVSVQFYATVKVLFTVSPHAFRPPPKVDSAVVRIEISPRPRVAVEDRAAFFDVVRAGFRSPRKQLHNTLGQGLWLPPEAATPLLEAAGIDPQRRAQTLSLDEWVALTQAYLQQRAVRRAESRQA